MSKPTSTEPAIDVEVEAVCEYLNGIGGLAANNAKTVVALIRKLAQPPISAEPIANLLNDAAEEIARWGSYASPYIQAKHDLDGVVQRFRDAAKRRSEWNAAIEAALEICMTGIYADDALLDDALLKKTAKAIRGLKR